MGLHDRPYMKEGSGGFRVQFRRPGPKEPMKAVTLLIVLNIGAFIFQALANEFEKGARTPISDVFAVRLADWWQLWRYVTFQFLHADFGHILWNMVGVLFLGRAVERVWGRRRFLLFYLTSGMLAGVAYVIVGKVAGLHSGSILRGASGGVFAVALACMVLFWRMKMLLFFMLPVPMWVAAAIWFLPSAATIVRGVTTQTFVGEFWSDVAHFGGALGGAIWLWVLPRAAVQAASARMRVQKGAWQRKVKREQETESTIDEILKKIHDQGISSLTDKEKRTLAQATERQRGR